ncbi:unnamed protein product, partial [Iphiclides podalirius]
MTGYARLLLLCSPRAWDYHKSESENNPINKFPGSNKSLETSVKVIRAINAIHCIDVDTWLDRDAQLAPPCGRVAEHPSFA